MRIMLTTNTGRLSFDEVEMIIVDEIEMCIWQPNIGRKKGSRRTRFARNQIKGIIYLDTLDSTEDTKREEKPPKKQE